MAANTAPPTMRHTDCATATFTAVLGWNQRHGLTDATTTTPATTISTIAKG
ncbi:hypothetical protein RAE21_05130 [Rhodoferax sp. TBRC 17198]|uniref:hypothetical protein n=1 Tax=Rhodoferax potami TaxID=3068338 RepID=UPI0028BF14CE|nr:hypothetical protein [Rhodoferax sp. TBRC 17198]MDT7521794.1 hypothetical protein [Rhodoferax sp. TBRC 17198]